jgi:hypothetical protein
MALYEPEETDISLRYLLMLAKEFGCKDFGIMGGWATFFLVDTGFREATGNEYLRSRDIDVFISSSAEFVERFKSGIAGLGFFPGAYRFRYSLVLKRDSGVILNRDETRAIPAYETICVDLDVFSEREVGMGTWVLPALKGAFGKYGRNVTRDGLKILVPGEKMSLDLKGGTYLARDREHKRIKDTCDIYALLFYSGLGKSVISDPVRMALKRIIDSGDTVYIAEHLFGGRQAEGLVRRNLETALKW